MLWTQRFIIFIAEFDLKLKRELINNLRWVVQLYVIENHVVLVGKGKKVKLSLLQAMEAHRV
jgi:hypothetical protein